MKDLGYEVVLTPHTKKRYGYVAAPAAQVVADIVEAMKDPTIDALVCANGGWNSNRLLRQIPWQDISYHDKAHLGFSDISVPPNRHLQQNRERPNWAWAFGGMGLP